jgi:hypothetical protein
MPLQIHPHIRSLPVGRCIYCGATGTLYEEHIIAYAFGGNLTLKAASCADCGAKTGAMEQHLCDTIFQSVRVHRGFPSRGKRPLVTELYVTKNGQPDKIPASDHPGLLLLPKLDPPWFPKRHPHAVSIRGHLAYTTGSDAKGKLAAFSEGTNLRARFKPDRFSRVLAKIAHGSFPSPAQLLGYPRPTEAGTRARRHSGHEFETFALEPLWRGAGKA